MIKGRFVVAPLGEIQSFHVSGHQTIKKGSLALACAVVSASIRSFVRVCEQSGVFVEVKASERGCVSFNIKGVPPQEERYRGACAVLLQTFHDLQVEDSVAIGLLEIELVSEDNRRG